MSKFIIVVPSIAIREGVYKSLQVTQEHFAEEYGKKIRFFIYKSSQLTEIDRFASDSSINVMIINSQAFNVRGKDARRIYMKLDEFRVYCEKFEESHLWMYPRVCMETLYDSILQQHPRENSKSFKRFKTIEELQNFVDTINEFELYFWE